MIKEIKYELQSKIKTLKHTGIGIGKRPTRYVLWEDIVEELDYWIKQEEK